MRFTCLLCRKEFIDNPSAKRQYCSGSCRASSRIGELASRWNGGVSHHSPHGYIRVRRPNHPQAHASGYIFQHRLVAEKKIGRPLRRDEHVHHINGIKHDNCPDNLVVLPMREHASLSAKELWNRGIWHSQPTLKSLRQWNRVGEKLCRMCHKKSRPHRAHGYCSLCYQKKLRCLRTQG